MVLMILRGLSLVIKFLLTFFIARTMSLADLGVYGLVASGATIAPAVVGLGLNGVINRQVVTAPAPEAIRMCSTRLGVTLAIYAVAVPVVVVVNQLAGPWLDPRLLALVAAVLVLENLAADAHSAIIARQRVMLANLLLFVRSGAWPVGFMAVAWVFPHYAEITVLLLAWLAALVLLWAALGVLMLRRRRWEHLRWKRGWVWGQVRQSWSFYLSDIGTNGSLYLDRFLISLLLGIDLTGVYTFFWSLTNAIANLVFFGVTQPAIPRLVIAADQGIDRLLAVYRRVAREVLAWGAAIGAFIWASLPLLLKVLDKPEITHYAWLSLPMVVAVVVRCVADALNMVLYAMHRDLLMAGSALASLLVSSLLTLAFVPWLGVWGAAGAAWGTSLLVYAFRRAFVQRF